MDRTVSDREAGATPHETKAALDEAATRAADYLASLPERPVGQPTELPDLRARLDGPVPDQSTDPRRVIADLVDAVEPGLVASAGGRYFGFVVGGATPAALAADWLTSVWDQNAFSYVAAPAAAVVEEIAGRWAAELLGLPTTVSIGFVTGAQMANVTGLAAARHETYRRIGWDVEADGLIGAPRVRVLVGAERHATVDRALRYLGFGTAGSVPVAADDQGRMRADAFRAALAESDAPAIVCAQAGNVNSGAFDPIGDICEIAHEADAWVHVDGAFGLWAAASPAVRHLVPGIERADSWATDAHKWLNVPYDSGLIFCAHPGAHRAAMGLRASYLITGADEERDAMDYNPEASRRARGFAVYAALRSLGRQGIAELVDRCCDLARRFAQRLSAVDGVEVLNQVDLNQVLVRFLAADGDHDTHTRAVIGRVQRDGTCWLGGTTWQGRAAMRISVSNWSTTEADVDRSVDVIIRCAQANSPR
jgi:glutamate/tyrosine decarboxylase-like PLP-dependent enzyme